MECATDVECVSIYARHKLKHVSTPCIADNEFKPEELVDKGTLGNVAARIVLKVLYIARMARPDLLWAVNSLARMVTKWNMACDKRLHRLISYTRYTTSFAQRAYLNDKAENLKLVLFHRCRLCWQSH